jgi:hypothetical protein
MSINFFTYKRSGETITLGFDFRKLIGTGETIATGQWDVEVVEGIDASPDSMKYGNPSVSGAKISQLITGGVDGNVYRMICTANTSTGQIIQGTALLEVDDDRDT